MHWFKTLANRLLGRYVDPTGLAVFRIFYSSVLLCEVCQLFMLRRLVFDPLPFLDPAPSWVTLLLVVWITAVFCLVVGWQTTIASVVNYACSVVILPSLTDYEYHADLMYIPVNLLLIFTPISECISIDALRRRRPSLTAVSRVYADGLLVVGLVLIYADSVLYKLNSPMWTSGLGVWTPASLPHVAWIDASWLLNCKALVLGLGYAALIHEIIFPLLFWQRHARTVLLCSGVALHAGIALMFPIPWFALGALSLYVLMVPEDWFAALARRFFHLPSINTKTGTVGLSARIVVVVTVMCVLSQVPVSLQAPLSDTVATRIGVEDALDLACMYANRSCKLRSRLLGTSVHPVFMDAHFVGYEHVLAIAYVNAEGQEQWLPIVDRQGHPLSLNTGRQWVRWTWRLNSPHPDTSKVERGIREFTAYWASSQGIGLEHANFKILYRRLRSPRAWERDFLRQEQDKSWSCAGWAAWSRHHFEFQLQPPPWESLPAAAYQEVATLPADVR